MRKFAIKCINFYQKAISPNLPGRCKYTPTCSQYGKECYERFNFVKASYLTAYRILRCNPFSKGGYDPVPEPKQKKKKGLLRN